MRVSVVIPAFNEEQDIVRCLESLKVQSVPPYEIIVADNNSTDATAAIARKYGARVVPVKDQGISYARTGGFDAARGDIIARIDSDCAANPDWIEHVVSNLSKSSSQRAVAGRGYPIEWRPRRYLGLHHVPWILGSLDQKFWKKIVVMYGYNFAITRELWNEIRDEVIATDGVINEDIEFSYITRAHTQVILDKEMVVYFSMSGIGPRKLLRYLRADMLSQKKYS